jgi:hypothetical protein
LVDERPVTASLFTKCQYLDSLSANVEIGVPRSESHGLSGFPKALLVLDYLKTPCRIEKFIISWQYMPCRVKNTNFFEKIMEDAE